MQKLGVWLGQVSATADGSFEAHFRLSAIHPFRAGTGRTLRLLNESAFVTQSYPPVSVRQEDRLAYLDALEHASCTQDLAPFQRFMPERLEATLEEYLKVLG
jgi:Fic family protein